MVDDENSAERASSFTDTWPAKAADAVDQGVDLVREKVVRPIILAARSVVFGLLIITLAITVVVFVSVLLVRIFSVYLFHDQVWASYLGVGVIFVVLGYVLWRRRLPAKGEGGRGA